MCVSPVLATEYVAVILAVPGVFAETPLSQQVLADSSDDVLRYLVENFQISRYAEVGHPGRAEVQQLGVVEVDLRSNRDDHQDVVLPQVAGYSDGRRLEHCGMAHHRRLHLDRGDVLAPPPQRVLRPVDVG